MTDANEIHRLRGWLAYIECNFSHPVIAAQSALAGEPLPDGFEYSGADKQPAADKCVDCGSDMMEVCSGLMGDETGCRRHLYEEPAAVQKDEGVEELLSQIPIGYSASLHCMDIERRWTCGIDGPHKDPWADNYDFFGNGSTPAEAIRNALEKLGGGE